jgi:hypothetical protein
VLPVAPALALAAGARLLAALAAAEGAALLVLDVPLELVPAVPVLVEPAPVEPLPEDALATQAALVAPVVPPVAPVVPGDVELMADGLTEVDGDALVAPLTPVPADAEAAALETGAVEAAGALAPVLGPVLGPAAPGPPPHAASTNEAAASVGMSGFTVMDSSALARAGRT